MKLDKIENPRVNYCSEKFHNKWVSPCYICDIYCCHRCHHRQWIGRVGYWEFLYFCKHCYDKILFLNQLD